MGIHVIKMPDIGEGIAEVELVEWHVKPGDEIKEDQVLADVMTDKATVEIPSPVHGKVLQLGGELGQTMAVGSELIRIEVEGTGNLKDDAKAPTPAAAKPEPPKPGPDAGSPSGAPAKEPEPVAQPLASVAFSSPSRPTVPSPEKASAHIAPEGYSGPPRRPGEKPIASPAVRRRAWDMGIELQFVPGTGSAGRITHEDLDAFAARSPGAAAEPARAASYAERHDEEAVPVIGLRRMIAKKMQESKRHIPHFSYVEEIDVTELEALRQQLNRQWGESRGKLTLLPLLARAMVLAIREFPEVNARFDDENNVVTRYGAVHIGIATQTDAGLMVPVLRHAEARDLWSMAGEIVRIAEAARTAKASRDELTGSTITLTSLGALGGIVTTPVINHPEVAIVGVNRMIERPMFNKNGAVVPRLTMNLSSSFDHRVVDGAVAARFIQAIRGYLECPATLFVE
jgi:2-oxoisovalerate dehydrogenase E2 component (dihydrolipoyl transacylase)